MKANFNIAENVRNSRSISALSALRKLQSLGLLLCALLFGSMQMWGAVVSGTTYNTTSTSNLPTGWTGSDGSGTSYVKLIASSHYIKTDNFCQNGFTSITIKARKFGGPSGAQALITVSWYDASTSAETVLGTITPSDNDLDVYTINSPTNPTGNTTGYIKIQCKGASSSKGSGVSEVTITYTAGSCGGGGSTTYSIDDYITGSGSLFYEDEAEEGDEVEVTVTPTSGNYLSEFTVYNGDTWDEIDATRVDETHYSFVMPDADVTIYATFEELPSYSITYNTPTCVTSPSGTLTSQTYFATPSESVPGYRFEGWVTSAISGTTGSKPATIYKPGEIIPNNNMTVYALYSVVSATFTKVTGTTMPVDGGNYILCDTYNTTARVIKNAVDANKRATTKEWDCSGTTTTCTDWSCIWIFEQGTGAYSSNWFIYNPEVGKYLGANSENAHTASPANLEVKLLDGKTDASAWTCAVASGRITLTNKLRNNGTLSGNEIKLICSGNYAGFGYTSGVSPYFFKNDAVSASYTTNPSCPGLHVAYDANTSDASVANMPTDDNTYAENNYVDIPNTTPTRTGYTFDKWFTNAGCTTPVGGYAVNTDDAFQITDDVTLYAHWTPNPYRVDVASPNHVTIGVSSPTTIAEGAYANVNCGATVTLSESSLDDDYTAVWKVYKTSDENVTVSVTGSGNGATFTMPAYPVTVTATITPPYIYFTSCGDDECNDKYCINSYKDGGNGMTCFTDQGSDVWTITNYSIPATGQTDRKAQNDFWVGYDGVWVGGKSADWHFRWIPFKTLACNDYKLGVAAQAIGTLTINAATSGSNNNYELTFDPNGYGFCYGTDPSWETPLAFTRQGVTNVWNTSIVNVSDVINHHYYVGLSKLGGGYVFSSDYDYNDDNEHIQGISQIQTINGVPVVSNTTSNPVAFRGSNLNATDGSNGMRGYFQIWTDNCNRNFYCHFVPVYTITYKSYDGSSTLYTEEVSAGESFIVRAAETGSVGWAESSGQSAASANYTVGSEKIPTGNVTLYVACTAYTVSYTATSGTIERESVTVSSDVVVAGNSVTLPTVTGSSLTCARFLGWYAGDYNNSSKPAFLAAGSSYEPTGDVTLKALYAIVGDNYELVTSASSLVAGSQVVFAYRGWDDDYDAYYPVAMSETQQTDYRDVYDWQDSKVSLNAAGTIISWIEATPDVAEFTVEAGSSNGTYAFKDESGYIYCASTSSTGYLRTQATKDANASWTISISSGEAEMVSGSSQTRKYLWYNPTNDRFSCYASNYNNNGGKKTSIFQRSVSSYTTSPACTTYSVSTCSPGPSNGTISVSAASVSPGGNVTVTFTPSANYMLSAVTVTSGTASVGDPSYSSGPTSGGTVSITNIQSDITVCATFVAIPLYTVTFVDVDNSNATQTRTQASYGANVTAPSTSSSSAHDPCDNTWTFVGWAPSNTLTGETTEPTGFIAAGGTINGASITGATTYYSVYTNSSDGTTDFTPGKSGTYYFKAITTTPTTVYATGAIDGSGRYPTNNAAKVPFLITYNSVTSKYTIKNTLTDNYLAPTADGVGYTNNLQEQAGAFEWGLTAVSKYYASYGASAEAVTGEWLFTYVNKSSNTRAIYYDSYFKALGYPDYDSYALYLEPATSVYYYNASSCTDLVTMTFHPIAGGDPTWADGHPKAEYTDVAKGTISVFPTDAQEGWTFLGWTAGQSYNANREGAGETLDDDNASTTAPTQTIYSTGGNSYNLQADVDMYPVFTKFADNERFDDVNGGDYYIYYIADGDIATSQDAYGANNRIYASGISNGAYSGTANCADAATFTFTKLPNGKWTIYDNKNSGAGGKHYVCGEQTGSGNDFSLQETATAANYGEWTITVVSGNQFSATCFDDYVIQAQTTNATSGTFKNYASNNYSTDAGHYHRVYLGTCTERVYSSDPTNTPHVRISGTAKVTSTAGKNVKANNALSVSASNIATANLSVTSDNSAFKFSLTPNGSYTASVNIPVVSNKVSVTPVYVEYTPAGGSTSDGIDDAIITVSDGAGTPTTASTESGDVQGRHLPAKFLIATKVGDDWYALPNNTGSYSNPAAVKLSSVNEGTGVATYYSDQYEGEAVGSKNYLTWTLNSVVSGSDANYGYTNHGNRVRFYDSKNSKYLELKASDDDIKNSVAAGSLTTSDHPLCELLPTTTDLIDYTLLNEGQTKYLGVDGSQLWGAYAGSTTVRFLIPNQQPAPTLKWKNDMIDGDEETKTLATTKGENGIVVMPSLGDDPDPCAAASSILTFDGWTAESSWSGYHNSYVKITGSEAATTNNKSYYAVFKTTDNKYFTQCPNTQTVTYSDGAGNTVVETYFVDGSGKQITCKDIGTGEGQVDLSKSGYVLVGWTTSANYGSAFKYVGNTVTLYPSSSEQAYKGDLVLTAVWVGELTITGDVHLTSTYTSATRSEANTVYTTANPNNLITFSIADVPASRASDLKLRTSYLTSTDETQAASTCPFRLCNDGSDNYNIVDGGNLDITSGDYSQTYAIGYKPGVTGGTNGTTETYKLKMELINNSGSKVFDTKTLTLYGRVLPNHFVIAAKINGQWCAMPADIATSSGNAIANAYPITVNNQTTPTVATSAPKTALYSGTVRTHNDHRGGIRLATATGDGNDGQLQATRSDNTYLWRTTSECTTGMQEWYLVSSNFSQYEVRLDPKIKRSSTDAEDGADGASYVTRQLCVNGSQILFGTTSAKTMYILPVTEEFDPVEIQVVTWRSNAVQFMYFGNPAYTAEVEIEGVNKASAQELGSALKIDHGVYEIAVSDLMSNPNKQMHIIIKNGGSEIGRKAVTIPLMTNSATTVDVARAAAGINKGDCSGVDLVVLSNVLTAGDATAHEFNSVTVYGGAKLSVTGNLTAKKMYLRAGNVNVSAKGTTPATSYSYVYPQVYVGSSSTLTINENIINFDYLTNYDQYFGVAFPHTLTIDKNNIFYPADIYGSAAKTGSFLMRVFDSQIRAERGAVDDVWVDVEEGSESSGGSVAIQASTTRGLGYYVLLPPRKVSVNGGDATRQTYGIQRMKLSVANAAALTTAENNDASIHVDAYSASSIVNTGWWMLGNPYMASLGTGTGDADRVGGASITVGSIGTNAQGQYEWKSSSVRYVTVPDDGAGDTYDQRRVIDYDFPAFKPFYVQVGASGDVTFSYASRNTAAPARLSNNSMPNEINVSVALNTAAYGDTTYLLIGDAFSAAYEIGDDLMKMPHANVSLFTIGSTYDLFANALNKQSAEAGVPVGYAAPSAGSYEFSHVETDEMAWLEHLWLEDKATGTTVDLLDDSYEFETDAGTNKTRFVLFAVLKQPSETPTDIGGISDENVDKPMKFIYREKMYILRGGQIYDATGKKVKEINK